MSAIERVCSCAKRGAGCSLGEEKVQIRIALFCETNKEYIFVLLTEAHTMLQ